MNITYSTRTNRARPRRAVPVPLTADNPLSPCPTTSLHPLLSLPYEGYPSKPRSVDRRETIHLCEYFNKTHQLDPLVRTITYLARQHVNMAVIRQLSIVVSIMQVILEIVGLGDLAGVIGHDHSGASFFLWVVVYLLL